EYLKDIDQMQGKSLDEALMSYYLPKVVDEALKMHHVEIFVGDMIQEGNISLMMALDECKEGQEDEEAVMEAVRAGMQALLESQTETRRQDKKMVERVSELDETIKGMSEELGRKVSVEEVADRLGITEAEIEDILKLAGEEVKDQE
ncbi:MAG: sigma-70 domain-containing protein, partial [[Clostridium] scindens]